VQTPRSLRWDLPALDSPNLSPCEEDVTLCCALRSSECDLTACASISSGLKMKNNSLPSSLALLLQVADLPEIPDWYEDQPLKQEPEPKRATIPVLCTPTLDTPQSDYHSLLDYHPTSLCCQDILVELAATGQCIDTATPELSSSKHEPKAPQTMPQQAPSHSHWCPQPLRRSYSLVLGERRASEFPYMVRFSGTYCAPNSLLTFSKDPTGCRFGLWTGIAFLSVSDLFPHRQRLRLLPSTRRAPMHISWSVSRYELAQLVSQPKPARCPPPRGALGVAPPSTAPTISCGSSLGGRPP
jgi:hypothetical protein